MPPDLPLDPVIPTSRGSALTGLAWSPWAPLAAIGGQKQILLYNTDSFELIGIIPFNEGMPAHGSSSAATASFYSSRVATAASPAK